MENYKIYIIIKYIHKVRKNKEKKLDRKAAWTHTKSKWASWNTEQRNSPKTVHKGTRLKNNNNTTTTTTTTKKTNTYSHLNPMKSEEKILCRCDQGVVIFDQQYFYMYLFTDKIYFKPLESMNLGEKSAQLCIKAETRSEVPKSSWTEKKADHRFSLQFR